MGPKLGIYFSNNQYAPIKLHKGDLVEIALSRSNKQNVFLTKFNQIISLRKAVASALSVKAGDIVELNVNKVDTLSRSESIFKDGKIDLLALIPLKTKRGYEILVTNFSKNNEAWLRCWYCHDRGSARQIELRRYVDIEPFGKLLGQYQAEGTKYNNKTSLMRLEFKNKLISEHEEFINSLYELGIPKDNYNFRFLYNPDKIEPTLIDKYIREFSQKICSEVKLSPNLASKGCGFETVMRSCLLTEVVLHAMNVIRKLLANTYPYDKNQKKLAAAFFSKLLTGDGTLDIQIREYDYPNIRIKITDVNLEYLNDYSKIMENLGFKPKLSEKHIAVRAVCSFNKLLYLYKIKAFKNTNNWKKLLVLIQLCLDGRRLNTHYRFIDLLNAEKISSVVISEKYNVCPRAAIDWLKNKESEALLKRKQSTPYPVLYELTNKAKNLAKILIKWKKEANELIGARDPYELFESLKVKY